MPGRTSLDQRPCLKDGRCSCSTYSIFCRSTSTSEQPNIWYDQAVFFHPIRRDRTVKLFSIALNKINSCPMVHCLQSKIYRVTQLRGLMPTTIHGLTQFAWTDGDAIYISTFTFFFSSGSTRTWRAFACARTCSWRIVSPLTFHTILASPSDKPGSSASGRSTKTSPLYPGKWVSFCQKERWALYLWVFIQCNLSACGADGDGSSDVFDITKKLRTAHVPYAHDLVKN